METKKLTRQETRGCNGTLQVGYCDLQFLLYGLDRYGYNSGTYGWNYNCYIFNGVAINTGYRGMVGKRVDYKITNLYNEKARKIIYKNNLTDKQKKSYIKRLLKNYLKKVL